MEVKIKFNQKQQKGKWAVTVDGVQHLVDEVHINCKSLTGDDDDISCSPKTVSFLTKKNKLRAILK
jgi:hypothetical protein